MRLRQNEHIRGIVI